MQIIAGFPRDPKRDQVIIRPFRNFCCIVIFRVVQRPSFVDDPSATSFAHEICRFRPRFRKSIAFSPLLLRESEAGLACSALFLSASRSVLVVLNACRIEDELLEEVAHSRSLKELRFLFFGLSF